MTSAHRPAGKLLTYAQATKVSGKHLATVYRWVAAGHVRLILDADGDYRLSEVDVKLMATKKWTRRPHLRRAD